MKVINGIKMYDSQEVLDLLGISKGTLSKLRKSGKLRSVTIFGRPYTSERNIAIYLEGYNR